MRHGFWAIVLSLGAILGFASGFASLHRHGGFGHGRFAHGHFHGPFAERSELEAHVAAVCLRAADKLRPSTGVSSGKAGPP